MSISNPVIGINLMLWTASPSLEHTKVLKKLSEIGYDAVEIPIFAPYDIPVKDLRSILSDVGLRTTVSSALPKDSSLIVKNQETWNRGVDFLKSLLEIAEKLKAEAIIGPLYHPVGSFTGCEPTIEEKNLCIKALHKIGPEAKSAGIRLCLEPINRFETHFMNTLAQGLDILKRDKFLGIMLMVDTFHMNIEEKSIRNSLTSITNAGFLGHVHLSENDRGVLGSGQVHWKEVFEVLGAIGYGDFLVVEAFSQGLPELSAATRVWRDIAGDPMKLAEKSLVFIKREIQRVGKD